MGNSVFTRQHTERDSFFFRNLNFKRKGRYKIEEKWYILLNAGGHRDLD